MVDDWTVISRQSDGCIDQVTLKACGNTGFNVFYFERSFYYGQQVFE